MAIWEKFADFFGTYYTMFVAFTAHSCLYMVFMTVAWTSPVLSILSESEDNPLGRLITNDEIDLIGSLFYVGAALGPLLFMNSVEQYGRKNILVFLSSVVPISYAILTFASTIEVYYVCRVVLGVYGGAILSIEPVYVSEIVATKERDFLMSFVTVFGLSGILSAYIIGPFIPLIYFNSFIGILSFAILLLLAFACPESPCHIIRTNRKSAASDVLKNLRSTPHIENELKEIEESVSKELRESYLEIFKSIKNMKLLVQATIPLILQQYSGITLIITYSQLIFLTTDISIPAHICTIITAFLQVSTSFITPMLLKSNRFTQQSLLMFCFVALGVCNFVIGFYFLLGKNISSISWIPLLGLTAFVIFYNCGIDPIPWIQLGQIYPMNVNAVGTALSTSIFFASVFPMLYLFTKVDISFLFLVSSVSCFVGVVYTKFMFLNKSPAVEVSA